MIYLDNNSTTRVDPRVVEKMLPFFDQCYGNASSHTHELGRLARQAVEESRNRIASLINAEPEEIYFTSGATEANNLAIQGFANHRSTKIKRMVTSTTEHRAVIDPMKRLSKEGFEIGLCDPVPYDGEIVADSLHPLMEKNTALVSLMLGNNEIGACLDADWVGSLCKEVNAKFHCDAAQGFGRIPIDVCQSKIDLLSLSGHKIYGPKGIGALYVRKGVRLKTMIDGGGHERGKRSGTLNVPGIVGFAHAAELAFEEQEKEISRIRNLMELCDSRIQKRVGGAILNGPAIDKRLPGNLNYRLEGIDAETLTLGLPEVCLSSGSACTSAEPEPSHVLRAIGLNEMEARSSVRIGIGRFNTADEIEEAVEQIAGVTRQLRSRR